MKQLTNAFQVQEPRLHSILRDICPYGLYFLPLSAQLVVKSGSASGISRVIAAAGLSPTRGTTAGMPVQNRLSGVSSNYTVRIRIFFPVNVSSVNLDIIFGPDFGVKVKREPPSSTSGPISGGQARGSPVRARV